VQQEAKRINLVFRKQNLDLEFVSIMKKMA